MHFICQTYGKIGCDAFYNNGSNAKKLEILSKHRNYDHIKRKLADTVVSFMTALTVN